MSTTLDPSVSSGGGTKEGRPGPAAAVFTAVLLLLLAAPDAFWPEHLVGWPFGRIASAIGHLREPPPTLPLGRAWPALQLLGVFLCPFSLVYLVVAMYMSRRAALWRSVIAFLASAAVAGIVMAIAWATRMHSQLSALVMELEVLPRSLNPVPSDGLSGSWNPLDGFLLMLGVAQPLVSWVMRKRGAVPRRFPGGE